MLTRKDYSVLVLTVFALVAGIAFAGCSLGRIGLALDITGFLLLWYFGLPSDLKPEGKVVRSEWDVEYDTKEKRRFYIAKFIGHLAVLLVVLGFVFQFLATGNGR